MYTVCWEGHDYPGASPHSKTSDSRCSWTAWNTSVWVQARLFCARLPPDAISLKEGTLKLTGGDERCCSNVKHDRNACFSHASKWTYSSKRYRVKSASHGLFKWHKLQPSPSPALGIKAETVNTKQLLMFLQDECDLWPEFLWLCQIKWTADKWTYPKVSVTIIYWTSS